MASALKTEWDYSGKKGRDGQKEIGKVNQKRKGKKYKIAKDEELNGQGRKKGRGKGIPRPYAGL